MPRTDLGTSVFHILVALAGQDRHGYSVMQDVAARTDGRLKLSPGTLYGAIRRLLELGLIQELDERPDPRHDDERRRYYRLTAAVSGADREGGAPLDPVPRQGRVTGLGTEDPQ